MSWIMPSLALLFTEQGDVRLVDGYRPAEGRVEVYLNGCWRTVCVALSITARSFMIRFNMYLEISVTGKCQTNIYLA